MTIESPPRLPPAQLPPGAIRRATRLALSNRPIASADNRGKRVGVLIVAFNAVTTLATVLQRIPRDVWDNVQEVVVFDDASADDTYALAVGYKALAGLDKLTVLRNPKNLGYGGNQKLGYRYFLDKQFDAVVLLHGDGQYAPESARGSLRAPRCRRGRRRLWLAHDERIRRTPKGRYAAL